MMHFWGPHQQGTAIPALSEKLPEWHFLTHASNSKIYEINSILSYFELNYVFLGQNDRSGEYCTIEVNLNLFPDIVTPPCTLDCAEIKVS